MELAIDTIHRLGGARPFVKGLVVSELTWKTGQNHTVELFPEAAQHGSIRLTRRPGL